MHSYSKTWAQRYTGTQRHWYTDASTLVYLYAFSHLQRLTAFYIPALPYGLRAMRLSPRVRITCSNGSVSWHADRTCAMAAEAAIQRKQGPNLYKESMFGMRRKLSPRPCLQPFFSVPFFILTSTVIAPLSMCRCVIAQCKDLSCPFDVRLEYDNIVVGSLACRYSAARSTSAFAEPPAST